MLDQYKRAATPPSSQAAQNGKQLLQLTFNLSREKAPGALFARVRA
jgi:hypothetical protein